VTYGHGVQWLVYGYLQKGRYGDAAKWVDSMRAQTARLAAKETEAAGVNRSRAGYGAEADSRAYLVLDRAAYVADTRQWSSPLAMLDVDTTGLGVHDLAANDLALGLAALGRGERARADSILAGFEARMASEAAASHDEFASDRGYAQVMQKLLRAATQHAGGDAEGAVTTLAAAAAQDDSLPFAFGPPVEIVQPHELAGEYLLEMKRPSEAVREYKLALARAPGRTAALIGLARAQLEMGARADARRTYQLAAKNLDFAARESVDREVNPER
jgi:tetratricopeptide (TPR) repeat protein